MTLLYSSDLYAAYIAGMHGINVHINLEPTRFLLTSDCFTHSERYHVLNSIVLQKISLCCGFSPPTCADDNISPTHNPSLCESYHLQVNLHCGGRTSYIGFHVQTLHIY